MLPYLFVAVIPEHVAHVTLQEVAHASRRPAG
uniref:Uncharacterized protein n=1 Tax=Anguilla anguilla TaxID=7936 RepID=A0A0E9VCE0_ANGAN